MLRNPNFKQFCSLSFWEDSCIFSISISHSRNFNCTRNQGWTLLRLYLLVVSLSLIKDRSALVAFKEGRIHFNCTGWNAAMSPCMICLHFIKGRKGVFWGEEDNNYVMTVVVIQRSSVGDVQDWKVRCHNFLDTRKKKIMNDRHYDFIMLFVC